VAGWSAQRAQEHLLSLELFGMRFGLERMRRLLTALGSPQRAFRAVHVVGTNGKSSTARMTAGLLEAHGVRTGTFTSPHLVSFAERIRVGDSDLDPAGFGAAVERAAAAAALVERAAGAEERVTQFELLTAAALGEFARAEVEVAVVEAGLGGRYDATNVLDAPVVCLTNVSLEHTRWLGSTVEEIAREKLAVVRPGATLVLGEPDEAWLADARATGARLVVAPERPGPAPPGYQRRNFEVALAAAEAVTGQALAPARVADVAEAVRVPGRLQVAGESPLTLLDGAHNPSGVAALAATLGDAPVVAVVSILDDKDATGMLRALLPRASALVVTSTSSPRALPPATLARLAAQVAEGLPIVVEPDPRRALERARALAGEGETVLATGSITLVADLLAPPAGRAASAL